MRWAIVVTACLLAGLGLVSGAGRLRAQPPPSGQLQIEAPRYKLDQATHTYTYEDGKLTLGSLTLFASNLQFNSVTGEVRASGFIRVQNNEVYGTADSLEMNARTRRGTFHHARLYVISGGLFIRADTVIIHQDGRLEMKHCDLTSCKADVAAPWHLGASTVNMKPNDLGIAWNPVVSLGPMPIFWFPIIAWPTVTKRTTGVLGPRITQDSSSLKRFDVGWRLQVPVFLNLGFDQDLTLTPETIQHRGLGLGLEYNYAFWPGQTGQFYLWGIHENQPRDPAQENDILTLAGLTPPTSRMTRYWLDWSHNQPLGEDNRFVLSYQDSSDGQVRSEYERVDTYRPYRTYQASLTSQGPLVNTALTFEQHADFNQVSVYARGANDTDLRQIPQLLPSLTTHVGGRPLDRLPLRLDLGLRAVRFQSPALVNGDLLEAMPSISLPLSLGGAFELRPTVSRRMVDYTGLHSGDATPVASQGFDQNTESVELRTRLARVYHPDGGSYAAIKHRIVPRLIYTEVQDVPQPYVEQLEPSRVAEQLVTLRLDNTLLGRQEAPAQAPDAGPGTPQPEPDTTDLLHLNLIQNYDLLLRSGEPTLLGPPFLLRQESDPNHPWMPLQIELTANGAHIQASANIHYHYQLHRPNQYDLVLTGGTAAGTVLRLTYLNNEFGYVTPDNQLVAAGSTLAFAGGVPFSDSVTMGFNGRINLVDGAPPLNRRLDTDGLSLQYHPPCYSIQAVYSEAVTYTLENSTPKYYVNRTLRVIFDFSGLLGGPSNGVATAPSVISSNGFGHESAPASCHG